MNSKRIEVGKNQLIENIKILLYKKRNDIFEILNFEDDQIYQEPLLFAYFNSEKKSINLESIIYGYTEEHLRPKTLNVKSDEYGRIYLPNIGWFITKEKNKSYNLSKGKESSYILTIDNLEQDYDFEPIEILKGTNIELLKYPIPLLDELYYDIDGNLIDVEIEEITKLHKHNIEKALSVIKDLVPSHYNLIEVITKKIVIFNVETTLRNSFASMKAQGISFSNAYQEDYNEVFFIDDIAHQTGHLIFNNLIYDTVQFLKIDPNTVVEKLHLDNNTIETRSLYVVFHALYTYYTTFICLDSYLDSRKTCLDRKTHEAMGRIFFYIRKCYLDLYLIENNEIDNINTLDDIFTEIGKEIFLKIKTKYNEISRKWETKLDGLDMSNQPYNFTYSNFLKINPLNEEVC